VELERAIRKFDDDYNAYNAHPCYTGVDTLRRVWEIAANVKYGIYCGNLQHLQAAGQNRLHRVQKQERRKIIMNKIGESVHIGCRQLAKGISLARPGRTYHLPGRLTVTVVRPE
jgi:hypothetical protein